MLLLIKSVGLNMLLLLFHDLYLKLSHQDIGFGAWPPCQSRAGLTLPIGALQKFESGLPNHPDPVKDKDIFYACSVICHRDFQLKMPWAYKLHTSALNRNTLINLI